MKQIIVPIDFSDDSIKALEYAILFANKVEAKITMVNVLKTGRFDFFRGVENVSRVGDFENLVSKYKPQLNAELDYTIRKGKVNTEIVEEAKKQEAYMIIMGSHGMSGFEEFWIGSNAFRVVSEAHCPVLTMRKDVYGKSIDSIVMPIDITYETRQKVPLAISIANQFDAEIHVVGLASNASKEDRHKLNTYVGQTCEMLEKHHVKFHKHILEGSNVTSLTIDYAQNHNADLIIIMTEQEGSFSDFLLGSHAQQMVHKSPIPILTKRNKELVVKTYMK